MEQPTRDDDARAWRRYAGELRQRLGVAKAQAASEAKRAEGEHERAKVWRAWFKTARAAQRRAERLLDRVTELLERGDVPAAVDLLAERHAPRRAAATRAGGSLHGRVSGPC